MAHSTGRASEASVDSDISLLSINQKISAVSAGSLDSMGVTDVLMVGTQTNLLAYDVQNNTDVFYKDVSKHFQGWISKRVKTSLISS